MKYIDADRLKELLDAKYKEFTEKAKKDCPLQYLYMADGLEIAKQFIDSLYQEQQDVDIREEIKKLEFMGSNDDRDILHVAKHFYELGLKVK